MNERRERTAFRLIGIAFMALAISILAQRMETLLAGTHPATSIGGIAWLVVPFVAMLLLALGKRVTGRQLNYDVFLTEGNLTLVVAYFAEALGKNTVKVLP